MDNPAAPLLPQHWPIDVMKTDGGHSGHTEEETSSRRMQEVHDHMIVNYTLSNCEQIDHCGTYVLRSLNTLCSSVYGHSLDCWARLSILTLTAKLRGAGMFGEAKACSRGSQRAAASRSTTAHRAKGPPYCTGGMSWTTVVGSSGRLHRCPDAAHKAGIKPSWCRVRRAGWKTQTLTTEPVAGITCISR